MVKLLFICISLNLISLVRFEGRNGKIVGRNGKIIVYIKISLNLITLVRIEGRSCKIECIKLRIEGIVTKGTIIAYIHIKKFL